MKEESLHIILEQYKKENLTKDEAVKLIEDLYKNNWTYYPYYYWFKTTYTDKDINFPEYKITCSL